ncbi:hypothetical protein PMAYCL1PPCAC_05732, partial [Pristionchus mayeri]
EDDDVDWKLGQVNQWIGSRVEMVTLMNVYDPRKMAAFAKLIEKTHIGKLRIVADELPEELGFLVKTVVDRNVQKLILVGQFASAKSNVDLLLQLSSFVPSIHINQT